MERKWNRRTIRGSSPKLIDHEPASLFIGSKVSPDLWLRRAARKLPSLTLSLSGMAPYLSATAVAVLDK
jgi:hypothetical protein